MQYATITMVGEPPAPASTGPVGPDGVAPGTVPCFLVVETDRERRWLRRYASGSTCPTRDGGGIHNAMMFLEDAPVRRDAQGYYECVPDEERPGVEDPRWPRACGCGYVFAPDDVWQVFRDTIYRAVEGGGEWPRRELPPGAMYDAWWSFEKGADGHAWTVILPDGVDWTIDGPASSGGAWSRSGTPPRLTAHPSILTSRYHGFLVDGILRAC